MTSGSPHKGLLMRKSFPCHDVILFREQFFRRNFNLRKLYHNYIATQFATCHMFIYFEFYIIQISNNIQIFLFCISNCHRNIRLQCDCRHIIRLIVQEISPIYVTYGFTVCNTFLCVLFHCGYIIKS